MNFTPLFLSADPNELDWPPFVDESMYNGVVILPENDSSISSRTSPLDCDIKS